MLLLIVVTGLPVPCWGPGKAAGGPRGERWVTLKAMVFLWGRGEGRSEQGSKCPGRGKRVMGSSLQQADGAGSPGQLCRRWEDMQRGLPRPVPRIAVRACAPSPSIWLCGVRVPWEGEACTKPGCSQVLLRPALLGGLESRLLPHPCGPVQLHSGTVPTGDPVPSVFPPCPTPGPCGPHGEGPTMPPWSLLSPGFKGLGRGEMSFPKR